MSRYQGVFPEDAYDNKGNLKAGLTMLEDGRIMTQTDAVDANQKLEEKAKADKKKKARSRANEWGQNIGEKLGVSDWKVFDRMQPAWAAKIEDWAVNSGLFGKEGMIILSPKDMEGEGQEMEYNGYRTENFHICPSAISTFTQIKEMGLRGKEQQVMTGVVEMVDSMLGLEVMIKEHGGDSEDLYLMVSLNNKVFYVLGRLWGMTEVDYLNGFKFMTDHICTAASIVYGNGDKQSLSMHDDGIDVGDMPSSKGEIVVAEVKEAPEYNLGGTLNENRRRMDVIELDRLRRDKMMNKMGKVDKVFTKRSDFMKSCKASGKSAKECRIAWKTFYTNKDSIKYKNGGHTKGGTSALPLGPLGALFGFGKLLHKKQVGQKSFKHQKSNLFRGRKI